MSEAAARRARGHLSIGEVLNLLQGEFPDITISKIRFLESQGLIDPERTPSGYRKFYEADIARLRWILVQQRENFLPLKVIKERLESGELDLVGDPPDPTPTGRRRAQSTAELDLAPGRDLGDGSPSGQGPTTNTAVTKPREVTSETSPPSPVASGQPRAESDAGGPQGSAAAAGASSPSPAVTAATTSVGASPRGADDCPRSTVGSDTSVSPQGDAGRSAARAARAAVRTAPLDPGLAAVALSRDELAEAAGITPADVADLERFGLLAGRSIGPTVLYDEAALGVARLAAGFIRHGVEGRHLRMYKVAAEREASFFQQVVMPLLKQRHPGARQQAIETLGELAELGEGLRAAMLHNALRDYLGSP